MVQWINLQSGYMEVRMESKHLCVIVVVALVCMCATVLYALNQGINGVILSTALGIFGVIIGAVAEAVHKKKE
jgi:hypothetical protein